METKRFGIVEQFDDHGYPRAVIGNGHAFFLMSVRPDGTYTRPGYASQTVATRSDFDWVAIGVKKYPTAEAAKRAWTQTWEEEA